LGLTARYLADKSALSRFRVPEVSGRLRPLMEDGLIATCAIVDLEVLFSSRNLSDYEDVLDERRSLDSAPITPDVMDRAIELQHELARHGQHRLPIPDLVISAAAQSAGLVVLHYDADVERIAAAGGADHEWVVRKGSI
jgi:predicted nucleic acid-binding protein